MISGLAHLVRKVTTLGILAFVGFVAAPTPAWALTITFDYTYDTGGFFSGANVSRRDILDQAATVFTSRLTDTLTAITPSGGNSWTAVFFNPSVSSITYLTPSNLSIAANDIRIYVGAVDLGGSVLGRGGPGSYSSSGSSAWNNIVAARGQTGALSNTTATDFGPWGGAISFSSTASWYFDSNPNTVESFPGQNDFYSVAVHEIGHVLGIGTAASWFTYVSGSTFTGSNSVASYNATSGGNGTSVALSSDQAHWANGTLSIALGVGGSQEAALDPDLTTGTRKYFTALDMAGLQDIGWTTVPEASTFVWVAVIGALGVLRWRRRQQG